MKKDKILVIGACGQIGTELTVALENQYGPENVIAADIRPEALGRKNYTRLDVLDHTRLDEVVREYGVTQIYLLAATLSGKGEQQEEAAWKLNVQSLLSVLETARSNQLEKVFWPSSIAVFGRSAPRYNCPQHAVMEPGSVYGISKRTGEHWCQYYFERYGVDIRSIRFPGLISPTASPEGGATDYAVEIFHQALEKGRYECFLEEDTCLPMIYMPDAVRAILALMDAPKGKISIRTSYNLGAMSFAPCDLAAEIRKHLPDFRISYLPDHRNTVACGGPLSMADNYARLDWQWRPAYDLGRMTADILTRLSGKTGGASASPVTLKQEYPDFPIDNYVFTKPFNL